MSARRAEELIEWLTTDATVVVDAGVLHSDNGLPPAAIELAWKLAAEADRSILVTRACYLALRRTASLTLRPSGVVLVAEAGRALTRPTASKPSALRCWPPWPLTPTSPERLTPEC